MRAFLLPLPAGLSALALAALPGAALFETRALGERYRGSGAAGPRRP